MLTKNTPKESGKTLDTKILANKTTLMYPVVYRRLKISEINTLKFMN